MSQKLFKNGPRANQSCILVPIVQSYFGAASCGAVSLSKKISEKLKNLPYKQKCAWKINKTSIKTNE